jgi:hypothetical protein
MSRLTIYGRIETPDLRWAWIGLVVEGLIFRTLERATVRKWGMQA